MDTEKSRFLDHFLVRIHKVLWGSKTIPEKADAIKMLIETKKIVDEEVNHMIQGILTARTIAEYEDE